MFDKHDISSFYRVKKFLPIVNVPMVLYPRISINIHNSDGDNFWKMMK